MRTDRVAAVASLLTLTAAGCNAILGVHGGDPGTGGAGGSTSSSSSSTSASSSTSSTSSSSTSASSSTSSSGSATCPPERIPACTGTPCAPITLTSGEKFSLGVAVVGDDVYFASGYGTTTGGLPGGHLRRMKYDGTESTQFGDGADSVAVAADADNVYYTDWTGTDLYWAPLLGSAPASAVVGSLPDAADARFGDLAVRNRNLYLTTSGDSGVWWFQPSGPGWSAPVKLSSRNDAIEYVGIAADDAFVYWADYGAIRRYPAATAAGTREDFATDDQTPRDVTMDANRVYWVSDEGYVRSRKKDKSGLVTYLSGSSDKPRGILVDGDYVYWTTFGGLVQAAKIDGTTAPETVAVGAPNAYKLAADCGAIYWTHFEPYVGDTGAVYKVRKPH